MRIFDKKTIFISLLFIFYLLFFIFISPVLAQGTTTTVDSTDITEIKPPIKGDLPEIIARIIQLILGLIGVLALLMFIYGGFQWMTAAGNMEKVKKGKDTLVWAVLGLAIVFLAYSIVHFVITKILEKGS